MTATLDDQKDEVSFRSNRISNLQFSGNTTLIGANKIETLELAKQVEEENTKCNLKLNKSKTKFMMVGRYREL